MIDDINASDTEIWKYVNDTTIAEPVAKNQASTIQDSVDDLVTKFGENKFQLNESKRKEMRISFAKKEAEFAPIVINEKAIEVVPCVKLLGLIISKDLKWNCHVSEISRKALLPKQLKRACVATKELITFYTTCIRPVIEYTSPVLHNLLPN